MADPFRKLTRGERLPGIPGEAWNAFIDAAKFTREFKAGAPELKATPNCVIALVRNNTGADVDRFSVLGLGDPLILPTVNEKEFQNKLAFEGDTPATVDHAGGRFAVTLYPIRDGEIGKAVLVGAVPIKIKTPGDPLNIDAADIDDGDASHLVTASSGAKVLWIQAVADAGAGVDRWAIVLLGGGADKTVVVKITGVILDAGGKYRGRIMRGTSTVIATGDLAMPEGLTDPGEDNALVVNSAEDVTDPTGSHGLRNGYYLGEIIGPAVAPYSFRVMVREPVPLRIIYHGKIKDDYVLGDNSVKVWRCSDDSGSDAVEVEFDLTDPRQAAMSAAGWESENLVTVKLRHPIDAIGLSESLGLKAGRVIAFVADGIEIKDYTDYGIPGEPGNCIDYLLNAGTPDEVSVHECSQTVLTGAALPTECIKVYGKANAAWSSGNTISVNLCDRASTEYPGPLTFAAYITSPESGSGPLFCSIEAGQILALEEMAPGVFHCINVATSDGKVAVNKADALDFLEKQMVGDEVYTKTKTVTGDDKTPVVMTYHIAGKSVDKDTLVTVGVTVVGDTVTVTPKILHRDGGDHLRDWEVGTPVSFTRSGGSQIEGDGIWTDTKDTSNPSHPARKQVFHINTAGADAKFDLVVGAVDVDHTDPENAVYVWTPLLVHRDGTKHLENIEDNPAGEVTLTGDGIHIQLDDDGKIKHMDADLANEVVAVNVIQGFEIVDVGGLKHMRITFIGIHYDAGGHIVGIDSSETLDLPLTVLSVDVQTSWDSTAKLLRKKTQVIGVPYSELPSSYITIIDSTDKCS